MNINLPFFKKQVLRLFFLILGTMPPLSSQAQEAKEFRLGHFPNVTHAQALLAHANGDFEKEIGIPIRWTIFNAGPSAIEALFAGAIDATYVGPNPAINGYIQSHGKALRIVAGSASGGAALVVRQDAKIQSDRDFNNKIVATPQLGGTQDVGARVWFQKKGYCVKEKGGTLTVLAISNPDQLLLFQKKELDAAWTVEPWVSRLEAEGNGKIFLEEKTLWPEGRYVTTHLVVRSQFLKKNPGIIQKLIRAHIEVTQKLNANKQASALIINQELQRETGTKLSPTTLQSALNRVEFTWDPLSESLYKAAKDAHEIGFLENPPSLNNIYDLTILNEVLMEKRLPLLK